ncbi:hypothetical protein ACWGLK_31555 [Streptomyces albidoflavus]|uniref:hypothetical protein n=1 Tax=Streptomyces sp. NPDC056144 TaxID=3345726 RepID=UPI0035DDED6D
MRQKRRTEHCSCNGTGRIFDIDRRPVQCGPCTDERTAAFQDRGFNVLIPECYGCEAVLTIEHYDTYATLPREIRAYPGMFCAECAESLRRKIA